MDPLADPKLDQIAYLARDDAPLKMARRRTRRSLNDPPYYTITLTLLAEGRGLEGASPARSLGDLSAHRKRVEPELMPETADILGAETCAHQ